MRIVVSVTEANPELIKLLNAVPPRQRAERLRVLASVGASFLTGGEKVLPSPFHDEKMKGTPKKDGKSLAVDFAKSLMGGG
jgi:hypothetical protein